MWALARSCAPWVPEAGEKGKNALSGERKAFGMWSFGTRGRNRQPANAFFSFSPGRCLRCKKRAKAHTPRRAAIPGFLIGVPAPSHPTSSARSFPTAQRGPAGCWQCPACRRFGWLDWRTFLHDCPGAGATRHMLPPLTAARAKSVTIEPAVAPGRIPRAAMCPSVFVHLVFDLATQIRKL